MKNLIQIILCSLVFSSCKTLVYVDYPVVKIDEFNLTIVETNFEEVEKYFGKDYTIKNWDGFSNECIYNRLGVSFSYQINDSLKDVKWVNIELKKNTIKFEDSILINHRMTLKEFTDFYGYGNFDYDISYNGLIMEYNDFDLIIKLSANDKNYLKDSELIEFDRFKNRRIKGIEIY